MSETRSSCYPDKDTQVRQHFDQQAQACERLGSPFTAMLCRLLARCLDRTTRTGARLLDWPGKPRDDAVALRLCGALHALVLAREDEDLASVYPPHAGGETALEGVVQSALRRHDDAICGFIDSPPQTNEIARSAMLLPGFLAIGREAGMPLAIREVGSSGGLNLNFDRFHYRYGESTWGGDTAAVKLAPDVRGMPPPLGGFLDIASRKGCDIAPVDVADATSRLRLRSYIWPDQDARLQRLDAALAIADEHAPPLERIGADRFVERELAERGRAEAFVLFHSIMWQYMPETTRLAIEDMLDAAGNAPGAAPLAWLRMEPVTARDPFATLRLTLWPAGETRDFARCDYHGRWIEWMGED